MNSGKNRRSYFRIPIIIGVEYRNDGPPLTARITNMSTGGMFVACTTPLDPLTSISFTFHFPRADTEHPVVGEGRVIWNRKYLGMGVQFVRLGDGDVERIQRFLESFETE